MEIATAEELINDTVKNNDSSSAIIEDLNRRKETLEESERADVQYFIDGVRPAISDVLVRDLGATVGGLCDASGVTMGKTSIYVHESISRTIAQAKETRKHENYHNNHDHIAPMVAGSSASGDTVVTIGGHAFDETELIEGLTVSKTGDQFVSEEYVQFETTLQTAAAAAGISMSKVEEAVDQKDLQLIDDEDRSTEELSVDRIR